MKTIHFALIVLIFGLVSSCNRKATVTKSAETSPTIQAQASTPALDGKLHGKVVLSLERMPCRGTCPWDKVTYYEDGAVFYVGIKHVSKMGSYKSQISKASLAELTQQATKIGFFDMADAYPVDQARSIADLPTTRVFVDNNQQQKVIILRNDYPKTLSTFIQDVVASTDKINFEHLQDEDHHVATPNQKDHGTLVMTIKRNPCYGSCPWYEASFYDDGTILYEGKKHVDHVGKFKLKTNPKTVRTLSNKAQKIGFFKMEKAYPVDPSHKIADIPSTELMVKIGRTGKTIIMQNETPPVLIEYIKEIEGTLARLDYPESDE